MTREDLFSAIRQKQSFLTVGLDTDISKIPPFLQDHKNPILEFNKQIIDATHSLCVAYKLNIAFYEVLGSRGWDILQETVNHIPNGIFKIADAKRGDIGNTSSMYARTFFETFDFDAVTVAPYMGEDSVTPFLEHEEKWVILLGLTSNKGSHDFQMLDTGGKPLYKQVISISGKWGNPGNMMYVVGATHPAKLKEIREIIPEHFLLVPGVGAQGGDLEGVALNGMNEHCGLLVNSSRGIIYAGNGENFAEKARVQAQEVQQQMQGLLKRHLSITGHT